MAGPNQLTGRATITLDGLRLASKAEPRAKLMTGGVTRSAVLGSGGVLGYEESTGEPGLECVIAHGAKTSLKSLNDTTNATVLFDTDTGRQYVLRGVFLKNSADLDGGDVSLQFGAMSCEEL